MQVTVTAFGDQDMDPSGAIIQPTATDGQHRNIKLHMSQQSVSVHPKPDPAGIPISGGRIPINPAAKHHGINSGLVSLSPSQHIYRQHVLLV